MTMEFNFTLSDEDYLNFYRELPGFRRNRIWRVILPAVFVIAAGFLLQAGLLGQALPVLGLWVLIWLGLFMAPRLMSGAALRNLTEEERRVHLVLDEGGLKASSGKGEGKMPWSALHRVTESDSGFYFYGSEQIAHILPKRVLGSEEAQAIRELATKEVQPRPKSNPTKATFILWLVLVAIFALVYSAFFAA